MSKDNVQLPEGIKITAFVPVAYYDKHMDCIRVMTHDRSVTEHRLDGFLTLHECNHRTGFDPQYVGFTIKGIRHLFSELRLPLDGVYKLADLIGKIVKHQPGSTMAHMLNLVYREYNQAAGDLQVDLREAA